MDELDKYEIVLNDIKEILETIPEVSKVSHGVLPSLDAETSFTSVYITPEMDNFDAYKNGTQISAYTNTFYIRITAHVDCLKDDLLWVNTRKVIINTLLADTAIWTNIVDRDIISVAHDSFANYPRKALAFLFEFRMREDCIV